MVEGFVLDASDPLAPVEFYTAPEGGAGAFLMDPNLGVNIWDIENAPMVSCVGLARDHFDGVVANGAADFWYFGLNGTMREQAYYLGHYENP